MTFSTETNRLLIQPITLLDSHFILELVNTAGWLQFIGDRNIHTIDNAEAYIHKIIDNPNYTYWVCKLKESLSPVGIVTFIKRDTMEHHDIGFALLPAYEKMGLAYEATKQVADELISTGLYKTIQAITVKNNHGSIRLLEKLGLHFEKEITDDKETLLLYSMKTRAANGYHFDTA